MSKSAIKDALRVWGLTALLVISGFVLAYQFVKPAPPRHIVIASGTEGGACHEFALRYAALLAKEGVELTVLTSNGSIENLDLLSSGTADVAMVQTGVGTSEKFPELASLGCLFYEPLWVVMRPDVNATRLSQLTGRALAVGPEGSGTRILALELLADNGVTNETTRLVPLAQTDAIEALDKGEVDAMFWVTGLNSPLLNHFRSEPLPRLFSFSRWRAYVMRYDYLAHLTLPQGVLDLKEDLPRRDVDLLAATAELVVSPSFHPALADLFLTVAEKIHHHGGPLEQEDEFPRAKGASFPVTPQAKRFLKSGPPFLQRYLPFWVANFIDRMIVMLLPLITLLYPLMKIAPPAYRWQVHRRIYRWYEKLRDIDARTRTARTAGELEALSREVDKVDEAAGRISVPASFASFQYQLRSHVRLIRAEIAIRMEELEREQSRT